jgi:hypothetical protein
MSDEIANTHARVTEAAGKAKAEVLLAEDESRRTASQRRVNLIWESTQATIAVSVTIANLWIIGTLAFRDGDPIFKLSLVMLLSIFFANISGSYFSRTNHEKRGGVGSNYEGR